MPTPPENSETPTEKIESDDFRADKRVNSVIVAIVCCTAVIIASQFVFAELSKRDFHRILVETEYGKVGWEANYRLLQEIQRDRTASYLRDLEEQEPDYVRGIKKKIERERGDGATLENEFWNLLKEEVSALKSTLFYKYEGTTEISVVEFSDFACDYCQTFHVSGAAESAAKNMGASYAFKPLVNPKNEGSDFLARSAKCALQKFGSGAYYETVEAIFSAEELSNVEAAYAEALKRGIDKSAFEACVQSDETTALVEKDFGQGSYLKIRATPSVLILNEKTGEYAVVKGDVDETAILEAASALKENGGSK